MSKQNDDYDDNFIFSNWWQKVMDIFKIWRRSTLPKILANWFGILKIGLWVL